MGQRLLVVDADSAFVGKHRDALEFNFGAVFSDSPARAIQMLGSGRYAAILISADFPDKAGFALCADIRSHPSFQGFKIILVSSKLTRDFTRHKKSAAKANQYLHKSISTNALVSAIGAFAAPRSFDLHSALDDLMDADLSGEGSSGGDRVGQPEESKPRQTLHGHNKHGGAAATKTALKQGDQGLEAELKKAQQENKGLRHQFLTANANLAEAEAELKACKSDLSSALENERALRQGMEKHKQIEAELHANMADLNTVRNECNRLRRQNTISETNLSKLENELNAKTEELIKSQHECKRMQESNATLASNIGNMETELQAKTENVTNLKRLNEGLQLQNEAIVADIKELEAELHVKTEALQSALQDVQRQRTTITVNLEELEERNRNLEDFQRRLSDAETQLEHLESPGMLEKHADTVVHARMKESLSEKKALLQQLEALTLELAEKNRETIMLIRARDDSQQHLVDVEDRMHLLEREFETRVESERKLLLSRMEELKNSEAIAHKRLRELEKSNDAHAKELKSAKDAYIEERRQLLDDFETQKKNLIISFNAQHRDIHEALGIMEEARGTLVKSLAVPLADEGGS
jgi:CheY-like chemotaxis protein